MVELDLRGAAKLMGISAPTLMRIESGRAMDAETFMKILGWLTSRTSSVSRNPEEK